MNSGHNSPWERNILARVLLENHALENPAFAYLEPWNFSDVRNLLIFCSMKILRNGDESITIESLFDLLTEHGLLESVSEAHLCSLVWGVMAMGFGPQPRGEERAQ